MIFIPNFIIQQKIISLTGIPQSGLSKKQSIGYNLLQIEKSGMDE
ncbi:MAG: hypothetical protein ACD_15C00111G0003 [uncultured bacterium]|nr:MAG: hypothetical protein ACD_15C00111G0003 [uncultured bacterium]